MQTIQVGDDRIVVIHDVSPDEHMVAYDDAAGRRLAGWRMLSIDTLTTGFTGTAGNMLFDTGGGHPTKVRITILYERVPDPA